MRSIQIGGIIGLLMFAYIISPAQTFLGNGFMEGTYMEVGIGTCGAFTSSVDPQLPDSGHVNSPLGNLSVVADVGSDGWDVGLPNPYCGDYFLPGSSIEAFSLEIDSQITTNGTQIVQCAFDEFSGSNVLNWRAPDESLNIWRAVGSEIAIRQLTAFLRDRRYILNSINICNQSDTDWNEVYYMRTMDPDPSWAWNGSFVTENEILSQPYNGPEAAVVARSPINAGGFSSECIFGMSSMDDNARASYGGFFLGRPSDAWNNNAPYSQVGSNIADESVQMSWYWPQIPAGECICFSYAFVFDSADFYVARLSTDSSCIGLPPFTPEDPLQPSQFQGSYMDLNYLSSVETEKGKLIFAPNPGDGNCRFYHPQIKDLPTTCKVYDLTGALVHHEEMAAKPTAIQLAGLSPGMYLIELQQAGLRLSGRYVLR